MNRTIKIMSVCSLVLVTISCLKQTELVNSEVKEEKEPPAEANKEADVQHSNNSNDFVLVKKEYENASEANIKVPGTYPQADMDRLKLRWDWEKSALNGDLDAHCLEITAAVAKIEYDKAVAANKKKRGTFSQDQIDRLRYEWERIILELELLELENEEKNKKIFRLL